MREYFIKNRVNFLRGKYASTNYQDSDRITYRWYYPKVEDNADNEKLRAEMDKVKANMVITKPFGALPVMKVEVKTGYPAVDDKYGTESQLKKGKDKECVRKEIEDGTYYFEDTARIETLPGSLKFYHQGEGKVIQTPTETRVECNYHGEPYVLTRSAMNLESMHIEYDYLGRGDCVDISIPDDSFWCYLSKRDAITKISFATEEMHLLAVRKAEEAKASAELLEK